jgi:hypothetical protein
LAKSNAPAILSFKVNKLFMLLVPELVVDVVGAYIILFDPIELSYFYKVPLLSNFQPTAR